MAFVYGPFVRAQDDYRVGDGVIRCEGSLGREEPARWGTNERVGYYKGLLSFPQDDGSVCFDYGEMCPNECAIFEQCGDKERCDKINNYDSVMRVVMPIVFVFVGALFITALCCVYFKIVLPIQKDNEEYRQR